MQVLSSCHFEQFSNSSGSLLAPVPCFRMFQVCLSVSQVRMARESRRAKRNFQVLRRRCQACWSQGFPHIYRGFSMFEWGFNGFYSGFNGIEWDLMGCNCDSNGV